MAAVTPGISDISAIALSDSFALPNETFSSYGSDFSSLTDISAAPEKQKQNVLMAIPRAGSTVHVPFNALAANFSRSKILILFHLFPARNYYYSEDCDQSAPYYQ